MEWLQKYSFENVLKKNCFMYKKLGLVAALAIVLVVMITPKGIAAHNDPESGILAGSSTRCPAPVPLTPQSRSYWPDKPLHLSWKPVTGCVFSGYEVCVYVASSSQIPISSSTDDCPNPSVITTDANATTLHFPKEVKTYHWVVRANHAPDGAQWSDPWIVTIDPTLPFYQLFLPAIQRDMY